MESQGIRPASKRGLPESQGNMSVSKRGLPESQSNMSVSKRGLPESQGNMSVSKRGLPESQGNMSVSKRGIPESQEIRSASKGGIPESQGIRSASKRGIPESQGIRSVSKREILESQKKINAVIDNIELSIAGKRQIAELVLLVLLSSGHVLLEDVPGVGKTSLAKALAGSVSCSFKRIQFTPDVMPSDVTGFSIYNQKSGEFEFKSGSVMSNIVLADEINRASAKTQSSLLEAMEEKQVTVDSVTYRLEEPFMVIATQNPVESFGTYPLPEAQLDRFMIKASIGYPSAKDEAWISALTDQTKPQTRAVISAQEILELRKIADSVYIKPSLSDYIVEIVSATRRQKEILLGASPRGSIALHRLARSFALTKGRDYIIPEDIKYLAPFVLGHRIILTQEARISKLEPAALIDRILKSVMIPVGD